ncbi:MAG: hypothetical protein K0Q97_1144 [Bacillota bacterium]|nr:hypothetical protein [Bacillota bacterium]
MAFRYILGKGQFSSITTSLSTTARAMSTGILSSPENLENVINLVRTAAPLTSPQTVSKINTYLPFVEKTSTLLGMYSFLSRAQNYAPIEPLGGKSSMEKITSLMMKNKMPIGKMLAQPMLANGMEKVMANAMKDMFKNGNLGDMLSSFSNISNSEKGKSSKNSSNQNNDIDLSSLLETFMPLLNNMMSSNDSDGTNESNEDEDVDVYNNDNEDNYEDKPTNISKENNYNDYSETINQKHSSNKNQSNLSSNKKSNTYNNKNSNEIDEKPKPIRIRQKRYRN